MTYYRGLLPALVLGLTACASSRPLAEGNYQETRGPGVVMWTAKTLRILPEQGFEYLYSSDDISSGKNGAGSYQLRGRTLEFTFNGKPLVQASHAQLNSLPTQSDSLVFAFEVYQADAWDVLEPAGGVTVLVRDKAGQMVAATSTAATGRATLRIARTAAPVMLTVSSVGYQTMQEPLPPGSTAYKVYLQPSLGRLYEAGTVLRFQVVRNTGQRLVLRRGADKVTLLKVP